MAQAGQKLHWQRPQIVKRNPTRQLRRDNHHSRHGQHRSTRFQARADHHPDHTRRQQYRLGGKPAMLRSGQSAIGAHQRRHIARAQTKAHQNRQYADQ